MTAPKAVSVLPPLPLDRTYDYLAPADLCPEGLPPVGTYVAVEVGRSAAIGVVWGPGAWTPGQGATAKLKPLGGVLDLPPMRPEMRRFLERAAEYTLTAARHDAAAGDPRAGAGRAAAAA